MNQNIGTSSVDLLLACAPAFISTTEQSIIVSRANPCTGPDYRSYKNVPAGQQTFM